LDIFMHLFYFLAVYSSDPGKSSDHLIL